MKLLQQHIRWGQKAKVHTEQGSAGKAGKQAMQAALAARKEQAGKQQANWGRLASATRCKQVKST